MGSIRVSLAAAALLVVAATSSGCKKEKLGVEVECNVASKEAVECEVKQTVGTAEMEACWDFEVTCPNGELVSAPRQCQKVKGGGTENVSIPRSTLTNVDACSGGKPTAAVSNLTINGKQVK